MFSPLLALGCNSVSIISSFLTIINHLLTNTYKSQQRTENPCVGGSNLPLLIRQVIFGHSVMAACYFVGGQK